MKVWCFFFRPLCFRNHWNLWFKCYAMSYVHHTKDPRVCPTGSPVQCCPSLSREELYLPTTHTENENRLLFSCQQACQSMTSHKNRSTSSWFFFSDCLEKHSPTHPCQKILTRTSTFKWPKALFPHLFINTVRGEMKLF